MRILKFIILLGVIIAATASCNDEINNQNIENKKEQLPHLIYELESDTILNHQQLKGYFTFSDTSFLYIYKEGRKFRINPIFKINGKRILERSDTLYFDIPINFEGITNEVIKEVLLLELTIPHQKGDEVTFSKKISYFIK